jgi:hypothetical protein
LVTTTTTPGVGGLTTPLIKPRFCAAVAPATLSIKAVTMINRIRLCALA